MNGFERRELRVAEYRRLALAADAAAMASTLTHVREKHAQAAARWTALALLDDQPARQLRKPAPSEISSGAQLASAEPQDSTCTR